MARPVLTDLPENANIQGYWKLEEASGNRADETANAYTLTDTNTVTQETGRFGIDKCGDFEADNSECLKATDPTNLQITGDLTVSLCVKAESATAVTALFELRAAGENENQNLLYRLFYDTNGDISTGHEYGAGTDETAQTFTDANLSTGTWYHLLFRRDSTNKKWDLMVNKVDLSQLTYVNAPTGGDAANFIIGSNDDNSQPYDGLIDEVIVWNKRLTDAQADEIYDWMKGTLPKLDDTQGFFLA